MNRNSFEKCCYTLGSAAGYNLGNISYKRRNFDVQILNSLLVWVISLCCVKLVLNILSIFSVNI